ncbi:MAG: SOS response-associated peptidase [Caldilineaceae bacterium]|nr:SOS response-associated peptidase [Caldilineaceae bacterium]
MCGRFTLDASPEQLATLFDLPEAPVLVSRYNIAPTQPVGVVRINPQAAQAGQHEWALTYWGLIPSWAKDPAIGARMINARSETVTEKPAFRAAFKRRRCLVPTSGFFEWQKQGKTKQPYYITTPDRSPFAIAGLWEYWEGADGSALESCTLLTTSANALMEPLHDRMPVIVQPQDYAQWLGTGRDATPQELDQLQHLLRPYADDGLVAYPVSTYVNNARNEGVDCIQPL